MIKNRIKFGILENFLDSKTKSEHLEGQKFNNQKIPQHGHKYKKIHLLLRSYL